MVYRDLKKPFSAWATKNRTPSAMPRGIPKIGNDEKEKVNTHTKRANSYSSLSNILRIAFCASSTPANVAALAGTARAIAGPIPGKNAL
jgi:hypothetical protein